MCSIITDLEHYLLYQGYDPYDLWSEDEPKVNPDSPLNHGPVNGMYHPFTGSPYSSGATDETELNRPR